MEKHILPDRKCTEHGLLQPFSHVTTKKMHLEICRVCLGNSGVMVNIFGSTPELGIPIAEMISLVTGHHVFKDEFFSEIICRPCLEDATKAFKIMQTYERSYDLLCQFKEDFQEVDNSLEEGACQISDTQQVVDMAVKTESFDDDSMENGEPLGVPVKIEPLDGSRYSQKDNGFEVDSLDKIDQCPVKNEPIADDLFEEEPYQINDGVAQPKKQQVKHRRKQYESKQRHKCSYCPKTFPRPGKLEEHIRSHTRERPFKCPQCPCVFTTQRSVTRHLESHVVDEPFKCSHCSCSYKAKSSLKRHLAKHKETTPLKCDLCQHSYADKRTLESHRVNCAVMTTLILSGAMIVPTS